MDYIYDLAGKIKQVSDPTGTYGFAYDNMGRLIGTTTQYSFLPGVTYSNAYGYDAASNRTSFTAPDGSTANYAYDTLSRLTSLTDSLTGQFTFGYDALSRRTSLTRPNGVNTSYTYDSLSRLLSVLHQAGTVTLDGASYTYDNAGNRVSKTNSLNNTTENYTYGPLYQLTQVAQGLTTTESYTYDAVGNRLSSLGMAPYAYNSSNELTSTPEATFSYDANGNTLTKVDSSGTTTYGWDFENRLTSVVLPAGAGTVTFKYDPFGRRIQKSSASGTTNYVYDGSNSLEELDQTGAVLAHYAQGAGIDEPLGAARSGAVGFYEQDGLGSVTSLTGSTGAVLNSYTYDAFGNVAASTGSFVNPYQFTGRDYDPETGLRYYRARYYDPSSGRFLSEDPARFRGGISFYQYANNNSVNFIDPTGLFAELYCESIGSSRGGVMNSILLLFAHPAHCYIRVVCHGRDVYLELYGPPRNPDGSFAKYGVPHNDSPYNSERAAHSTKYPLRPPAGMKCCEFEDRLMQAFQEQAAALPPYNPLGPNSNTFASAIITNAGGTADFPPNAYGAPGAWTPGDLLGPGWQGP